MGFSSVRTLFIFADNFETYLLICILNELLLKQLLEKIKMFIENKKWQTIKKHTCKKWHEVLTIYRNCDIFFQRRIVYRLFDWKEARMKKPLMVVGTR